MNAEESKQFMEDFEKGLVKDAWSLIDKFACDNKLSVYEVVCKYHVIFDNQSFGRNDSCQTVDFYWEFSLKVVPREEPLQIDKKYILDMIHRRSNCILY